MENQSLLFGKRTVIDHGTVQDFRVGHDDFLIFQRPKMRDHEASFYHIAHIFINLYAIADPERSTVDQGITGQDVADHRGGSQ